jgi:hypothetical protein
MDNTGAPRYLAVIILALSVSLTTCDNFNQELKPEIEYNKSVVPAHNAAELQARINAIPPGGSGTVTVMRSFALGDAIEIGGNRAVTVEAYSGTTTVAVLTRGANFDGSFFDVQSGAALSLRGGREKGTLIIDGGGVDATAALVTVYDGELTLGDRVTLRNNRNRHYFDASGGGVVVVSNYGSFTMTGGVIAGNTASKGGGVCVYGSFTMTGGTISGNTTSGSYGFGGGVFLQGDAFTMSGGIISGNTASGNVFGGGGVCLNSGAFTMSGGEISGNTATSTDPDFGNGGGVYVAYGDFAMTDGIISGNTATSNGGGVFVHATISSFAKSGGTIYGDTDITHTPGADENTAVVNGHAVYAGGKVRNLDAGPSVKLYAYHNGSGWTYNDTSDGGIGDTTANWSP